jgi:serralysin
VTGINSEQDSELTFLTGIGDDGTVASQSFWTWNEDNPATYGGTSYESKWGLPTAGAAGGVVTFGFDAASNWTAAEQSAFVATLDLWAAVANISFQQVADASTADIDIERSSTSTAEGGITSLYPGDVGGSQLGSAVTGLDHY